MAQKGATPLDVVLNSDTGPLVDQWWGYSLFELATTSVTLVEFKDGTSTGQVIWAINMSSEGGFDGQVFPKAIEVASGVLHVDTTGSVSGVVFV